MSSVKLEQWDNDFYSPVTFEQELLALDTPAAWQTADHVYFIKRNGEILHSKGALAIGCSEFTECPSIPGLRLNLSSSGHITFAADFAEDKRKELHTRLGTAVATFVAMRSRWEEIECSWALSMTARLLDGRLFTDPLVQDCRECIDIEVAKWKITLTQVEEKKSVVAGDDDDGKNASETGKRKKTSE